MRLLLDTQVLLWWLALDPRLPEALRSRLEEGADDVVASAVVVWEIAVKRSIGKLETPDDLPEVIDEMGLTRLPITIDHAHAVAHLPMIHRDPFDRLLVAQARVEGLTLVSFDQRVRGYDVPVLSS